MKQLFRVLFFLLPLYVFANNPESGTIKGQIKTNDQKPASSVTVQLKGSNKTAITEEDGSFAIYKVATGTYQLEVSLIGYETLVQEVVVEKDKITGVSLQLTVSNTQLQEVVITNAKNKFANKNSDQVARLPLRNLENPQVYSVVGRQLAQEQVVVERQDMYRNIPGAVPNFAAGGSQGMSMRGFANSIGMRNGMMTSAIVPLNPIILERVEAIKGPSGTLFGGNRNITFGGVFNYVTKKPYDEFGGEVSLAAGSFELARITADINTPLNKEKAALFRLNAAAQSEGSFQDQGYAKNYTFAPSFTYIVNDRLTFDIEAEITRSNYTVVSLALGNLNNITARNFKDLPLGYKSSMINNSVDVANGINNVQAQATYKISNGWKSQTNFLYSEGFYKHLYWTSLTMMNDSTFARVVRNQTPETFGNIQLQQNFIGDFLIGSMRNRIVVGLDYNYNYNELYRATVNYDTLNIRKTPSKDLSVPTLELLSGQKGFATTSTKQINYSAYVSDVFNITPQLMAMLSLRFDRFTTDGTFTPATGKFVGAYNQNSLSPKLGLVYQLIPDQLSVFGNYVNGFVNLAPATQPDNTILELKPQYGNQWEGGVKFELLKNKLSGSVSLYDIAVTNSTRIEVINGKNFTVQDGTQNSKGFDAEVIANPVLGLNIVAGYAFNENRYSKAAAALEGKYITFSPRHVGNIWVSYTLRQGKARGLGFGAGGNYVGDSWFESTNVFKLPAYTLINAAIFYDQVKYRISLKGNNLTDEQFWNTNGSPQKPLNFIASVAFRF
ncbi:TonB-dependent receptor [Paraflavitalea sp. CAU 1676]|uniref:TonB-dependent receptor n=1 Tax=Paraflavitalea sp. CAU 1676 TaxID=3032598 RepID=UPI0023DBA5C6|nr:TonB-dependent receptor [Paraflavitalea sp. CAU 1676]MDF2190565.1 TonB-dependent receptor [Paraflavitalea sp. CAU 1676]